MIFSGIFIALTVFFFSSGSARAATASNEAELIAALSGSDSEIALDGSITLTADINVNRAVTLTSAAGSVTLNTANHSLIVASGGSLTIDGALTVTGSGTQTVKVKNSGIFTLHSGSVLSASGTTWHSAIYLEDGGTANIEGGTVVSDDNYSEAAIYANGGIVTVNVSGGEITGYSHGIKLFYYNSTSSRSTVSVSGGKIATNPGSSSQRYGLRVEKGNATVSGNAEIDSQFSIAVDVGSVNIDGGTINGDLSLTTCPTVISGGTINGTTSIANTSTVDFTGGTFNGQSYLNNCDAAHISGGTFNGGSGSAIQLSNSGDVTITGGAFSGSAGVHIGGVRAGKSVSIGGNAQINGSTHGLYCSGGNVDISGQDVVISGGYGLDLDNGAKVTMSKGSVTGSSYGGVFIRKGGELILTGGSVTNTNTNDGTGGIYIQWEGLARITSGEGLAINGKVPIYCASTGTSTGTTGIPEPQIMALGETNRRVYLPGRSGDLASQVHNTTSPELGAVNGSWSWHSLSPVAAGNYYLVIECFMSGRDYIFITVPVSVVYSVSYNGNGGSGSAPEKIYIDAGETFTTAAANTFTAPTGKQFWEWNSSADGSGTQYGAGAIVTMPANNLILYAIWEDIPLTYTASISPPDKVFPAAAPGYSQQAAQEFTITNTGTGTVTGLSAVLMSGIDFEISAPLSADSLSPAGTATVSVRPKTGLAAGTYADTLSISGNNGVSLAASLSFTVNPPATYGISLDKGGTHTFAGQTEGYASVSPLAVTVSNTGNQATGDLTVALSGANPGSYTLSGTSIGSIDAGGSATFTVAPNTGLPAGTYAATVTVSGGNITEQSFALSFEVQPAGGSGSRSGGGSTPANYASKFIEAAEGGGLGFGNATVEVPAGALPADATLKVERLTDKEAEGLVPSGLRVKLGSDVYEITTSGDRHFGDNTLTVRIAYDPAKVGEGERPVIRYYDETAKQWVDLPTTFEQGADGRWYAVTRVNHLTKFAVFSAPGQEAAKKVIILTLGQQAATVDGQPYTLDGVPFATGGRTLVPIRFVSEALGAEVEWNAKTRQVAIRDGDREIVLTLGSANALVNGQATALDCAPATMPPGRTFVPLRFVSETLGATVDYDPAHGQITITR